MEYILNNKKKDTRSPYKYQNFTSLFVCFTKINLDLKVFIILETAYIGVLMFSHFPLLTSVFRLIGLLIITIHVQSLVFHKRAIWIWLKQGYCKVPLKRSLIQSIRRWCLPDSRLHTSNRNCNSSSCKSRSQHSATKARLPTIWSSSSLWKAGSSPFRSYPRKGLGDRSWFSWSSCW